MLWQPLALAIFPSLGLVFTFAAVRRGDISVAAPVFGIKIMIIAFLLSVLGVAIAQQALVALDQVYSKWLGVRRHPPLDARQVYCE